MSNQDSVNNEVIEGSLYTYKSSTDAVKNEIHKHFIAYVNDENGKLVRFQPSQAQEHNEYLTMSKDKNFVQRIVKTIPLGKSKDKLKNNFYFISGVTYKLTDKEIMQLSKPFCNGKLVSRLVKVG